MSRTHQTEAGPVPGEAAEEAQAQRTPPATDPTGIGPPPAGAAVAPDGAVTAEPPAAETGER